MVAIVMLCSVALWWALKREDGHVSISKDGGEVMVTRPQEGQLAGKKIWRRHISRR